MAEEGVIVNEEAAVGLAHYLTEIGRLGNKTAREVGAAIQSGVNTKWGMAKVPQFRDASGIGWIVEISERFNGEVLYAIVRSEKGQRHVTKVIDDDKLREMFPKAPKAEKAQQQAAQPEQAQQGASPAQITTDDNTVATLTQEVGLLRSQVEQKDQRIAQLNAQLQSAQNGDPDGPALVRWKKATKTDNGQGFEKEEEQITVRQVGGKIQDLIEKGVKAEHIEVWSRRQQPKVRFDLE